MRRLLSFAAAICLTAGAVQLPSARAQTATAADQQLVASVDELLQQSKLDDAIALLNKAIAGGGSAVAYTLRCGILTRQGHLDDAKADCTKALQLDPNLPLAHENQGDLLYNSGDIQGSLKEYDAYIAMRPSSSGGYWRRCDSRRRTDDWAGAQSDCDKAFALSPDEPLIRVSRGRIELHNQQYDKAYQDFDAAVAGLPGNTGALYWRGYTALQMKRYDQAVSDFTAAIKAGDDTPDTYHYRSNAYSALGKTDLAKADWETMIAQYRKYGECDTANAMALMETAIFGGNKVTAVICK